MLRADEIDALRGAAEELTAPIVDYLIQDLAKRVAKAGQFTATAQYETWKLQELGLSQREIKKRLKKLKGLQPGTPEDADPERRGGLQL